MIHRLQRHGLRHRTFEDAVFLERPAATRGRVQRLLIAFLRDTGLLNRGLNPGLLNKQSRDVQAEQLSVMYAELSPPAATPPPLPPPPPLSCSRAHIDPDVAHD